MCNEAAIYAARENAERVAHKHLDYAIERVIAGESVHRHLCATAGRDRVRTRMPLYCFAPLLCLVFPGADSKGVRGNSVMFDVMHIPCGS